MANSQSKFYVALVAIVVLGVALIGYVVVKDRQQTVYQTQVSEAVATDLEGELVSADVGLAFGSPDAPVVIEEYADYQCPYCGMVASLTVPQILEEYVETGKARFIFYDFPLHQGNSWVGAQAARCAADQDAFWPLHKVLMGRMSEWGQKRDPRSLIRQYADGLGLDGDAIVECIDAGNHRDVVTRSQLRARQLGLTGTPTFIINGRRVSSAMGFDQMSALIEQELAKQ
jgi:protein-disulfide isomerase